MSTPFISWVFLFIYFLTFYLCIGVQPINDVVVSGEQ